MTLWSQVTVQVTWHGSGWSTALDTNMATGYCPDPEHPCGPWWHCGPPDITMDSGCGRTMDPDMVFSSNPAPDVTLAPGDCAYHSDPLGPLKHGPRMPTWLQVAIQTTGLCTALSVDRSHRHHLIPSQQLQGLGPSLALGRNPGPETTPDSGG